LKTRQSARLIAAPTMKHTSASTAPFIPTKAMTKAKMFVPPRKPIIKSLLPNKAIRKLIKNIVLKSAAQRLAAAQATIFDEKTREKNLKLTPVKNPIRTRGIKHTAKVAKGLMARRVTPKELRPKHCIKLVRPNMAPKKAPEAGPINIAPTATGIVIRVISRPGVFK